MKILVTGASAGIGKDLASLGAKRNHDLILVARRKEQLDEIAKVLMDEHNIDVEVIAADLTEPKQMKTVVNRISQGDVDVLINNAGFGSSGPFVELEIGNELNEIDLNVRALVELSHAAANEMIKKRYGTIVNVSSIASYQPMSGNATYGATKAFVTSFSHALREELSETGVNVMVVCPGPTETDFFQRSRWFDAHKEKDLPSFMWQSSEQVAKLIFAGIDKQKGVVIPGVTNKLLAAVASSLPGSVTRKVTAIVAKGRRLR